MSGSASRASIYEKMIIRNDKKEANLITKISSFNYFESVYSPEVTANLVFLDASGSLKADKAQDTQERLGSIKSSLPIVGDEDLEFKIKSKSGTLDFSKKPLRVNSAPVISEDSNRQSIFLSLVSNATIDNLEIKNPTITYKGRISNTVKKILRELKIRKFKIDKTRNSYDFISRSKGGLDLITDLCRRSIPTKGDPGYFFYETQDGHNFRAIDNLISKRPVETYTYTGGSSGGYSKTNHITLDIGSLDYQNLTPNNDPREWQAKSPMRYNLLHSQMMEIQVPCNLELRAGDVIKVEIERQGDDKELGGLDEHTSGKYLILHLCHHFDSKRSFTSMTLARDTYGLHVKGEENNNEEETD